MTDINEWVNNRIKHCETRLKSYQEELNFEKDTCYKGYGKGYWQGKLDAFEAIKEKLTYITTKGNKQC